jgi:hypothetical protein
MNHVYIQEWDLNEQVWSKTTPLIPYKELSLQCEDVWLLVSGAMTGFCGTRTTAFSQRQYELSHATSWAV